MTPPGKSQPTPAFVVITYSLRDEEGCAEAFYSRLAGYTDEVLQAGACLEQAVAACQDDLLEKGIEAPRTPAEHLYELLTLGVLWQVYAGRAQRLAKIYYHILAGLAQLRQKQPRLKPAFDYLRGKLAAQLMIPAQAGQTRTRPAGRISLPGLERLLNWLEAAGDYPEALQRLRLWRDWLIRQDQPAAKLALEQTETYAAWFTQSSLEALGVYTPEVEQFLKEKHRSYRGREDYLFTGRPRVEYHLNMVGTEVMNRALRPAFLSTQQKVVLLPPCMAAPVKACQARATSLGALCVGCSPGCRVNQLTRLGEKYGFQVFQLPEELRVFKDLTPQPPSLKGKGGQSLASQPSLAGKGGQNLASQPSLAGKKEPDLASQPFGAKGPTIGVVGVSCALTNANGGWQVRGLGIPAQGLLLDYCGCSYHWHPQGIPTDINHRQLLRLLGISTS